MQLSNKKKHFVNRFLYFWNQDQILNILEKKITLILYLIPILLTVKDVLTQMSKKSYFKRPFASNMVNGAKHCWNLRNSTFIIFIDHYEESSVGKFAS